MRITRFSTLLVSLVLAAPALAQSYAELNYNKHIYNIPMRDGVKLHTIVYTPKDDAQPYPFILFRTPYSIGPYGEDEYRNSLGPNAQFMEDGYIFVYQDVRGTYMSEGEFVNMTPHKPVKNGPSDIDESTDCYDTIEWLINNIPNHNGKVGQWGISYPGFYTAASMIDHHPALVASSPQAPIADWWYDDFHHHGAFFLPHAFNFLSSFGRERPEPTPNRSGPRFDHGTPDGYEFFLNLGSLKNANERHFKNQIHFWNMLVEHPNYDDFWQAMNILPHLKNVPPAVMTVGGWFDAEDLYGPLQIYRETEKNNPDAFNILVMGPWSHGQWNRDPSIAMGNIWFEQDTSRFYQENILRPFFRHWLKGEGENTLPETYVFETGAYVWRTYDQWPPAAAELMTMYTHADGRLDWNVPRDSGDEAFIEFVSDPSNPVPFTEEIATGMTREYMTADQRFAARRPDVVTFTSDVLQEDVTLAGPLLADLWVSTSGTDSDWIVKVVDIFPPDAPNPPRDTGIEPTRPYGNYHMMVRSEVIRGRFRNDPSCPEPFMPNEPTNVKLLLQDVLHTFKQGHRIQVQVQCSWFPLVDRNPQTFVPNIYLADEQHFRKATQRVYSSSEHPTALQVRVLQD